MRLIAGASVPLVVGAISVLMGIAGIAGTRAWVRRATGTMRDRSYFFWSLGIFGLLPAWLVVFVYLIPTNVSVGGHGRGERNDGSASPTSRERAHAPPVDRLSTGCDTAAARQLTDEARARYRSQRHPVRHGRGRAVARSSPGSHECDDQSEQQRKPGREHRP
jgi:hypothetical protein